MNMNSSYDSIKNSNGKNKFKKHQIGLGHNQSRVGTEIEKSMASIDSTQEVTILKHDDLNKSPA